MSTAYDGRAVANFVLTRCDQLGKPVSNLSLQKILFFCHVWHLLELDRPLIRHCFEAWEHGPVLQYLYHEFKGFGASPITNRSTAVDRKTGERIVIRTDFERATENLLQRVIDFYARMPAGHLVQLSHAPGGPWDRAWNHSGKVNPGMQISDDAIVQYYTGVPSPYRLQ